jgi:hypothetical protein
MQSWAAEELRYADLGDKRLNRRLIDIVVGVTQLAVSSFPCHHDSRSNPTLARGGKADESSPV